MEIGIIGLPNVGKSSLFNALTNAGAMSSNYPFTTIEPNVGVVPVPDKRLDRLFDIFKPPKKTPSAIKFVDIAGLVKGASQGEGLGNKFLANIREVDAVIHVVRLFKDDDVAHVMGEVDPVRDIEVIETELMLSDLETVEKLYTKCVSNAKSGEKAAKERLAVVEKIKQVLSEGKPVSTLGLPPEDLKDIQLLTTKPVLFVGNNSEHRNEAAAEKMREFTAKRGAPFIELCVKLEADIVDFSPEEKAAFLADAGTEYTGLEKIVIESKKLLDLIVFFTAGPEVEVRSWIIHRGCTAPKAAGKIHSDIERGFIRAEIYSYEDIDKYADEKILREKGLIRSEGKEYVMRDGDVCVFRFNV